jgi:hypothetical protein
MSELRKEQTIIESQDLSITGDWQYATHPAFTEDTQLVDKKYVDENIVGGVNEVQIYYVGKHGNDTTGDGKNIEHAFLTFGKAVTEINLQSPSPTNQFVIRCHDAGIYDEQIVIGSYIHIFAPDAILKSNNSTGHTLSIMGSEINTVIKLKEINANSSDSTLYCYPDATSYVHLDVDEIKNTGTGVGLEVLNGYAVGHVKLCQKLHVGTNGLINLKIDSFTGNGDLLDGSMGSLTIGRHLGGTLTKGSASTISVEILNPGTLKFGNTTLDPMWSYSSHPTFTVDTQLVDKKYVDDHPGTLVVAGVKDLLTVTTPGQTAFTLSQTPINDSTFELVLNHTVHLRNGVDYTYSGTSLTWLDPDSITLDTTDELVAHYNYQFAPDVPIKSAFFSLMHCPTDPLTYYENYVGIYSSGGSGIRFSWTVPEDYHNTVSIKLLALAVAPATPPPNPLINIYVRYGSTGEDRNTHTQNTIPYYVNWSTQTNKFVEIVISDIDSNSGEAGKLYNNIVAGDRCSFHCSENGMGNILYFGIQINYT